jgi:gliding motility-associated-like protein
MTGSIIGHSKRLIFCLLIMGFGNIVLLSQQDTIINSYAKVLIRNDYQVTVDNATGFHNGDYILIIQMKGVSINADNAPGYGDILDIVGVPGQYEFLIVNSVIGNVISFGSQIKNYDPSGFVQIVKVPFFNSASFNNRLTCKPWDPVTGTGGILAMIVGRTLTLKGDIDVAGKGFIGGNPDLGTGDCAFTSSISSTYSFDASFGNAGYKGEGNASHYTPYLGATPVLLPQNLKGQGALFSGGGGGNGRFSGGGGGSNRGLGVIGGVEDKLCNNIPISFPNSGGQSGYVVKIDIDPISNAGGVFMGGGGGSSTHLAGATATKGGNGGGIVFIIADTIKGNNKSIIASGDSARTATGIYSGGGGGGAGGSIMIFSQSYSISDLNIKSNGSKGGDVYHNWATSEGGGTGGAGGGGYIGLLKPATPKVVISEEGGGQSLIKYSGFPSEISTGPGVSGLLRTGIVPVLTGFLFNSISSSVTGNQIDSVCSNILPPKIVGTTPVGGTPGSGYVYTWEKSYTAGFTSPIPLTNDANPINYTPSTIETATVYYRRTVTDHSSPSAIIDISIPVKIIVQPAITGNNIGKDTTICQGQNPVPIGSIPVNSSPSNGNGIYSYKWLQTNADAGWDPKKVALGSLNTGIGFDPPVLNQTTYYKRYVQSGRCISFSNSVKDSVLKSITGNIISRSDYDSVICEKFAFPVLGASAPGKGSGSFLYQWQDSTTSSTWLSASGSSTGQTYFPDTSKFSAALQNRFYRRVVLSGPYDVCKSKSQPIRLTRFPKIKNNLITANPADLTICSGSTPVALPGSAPTDGAGAGSYSFLWRESSDGSSFGSADGTNNSSTGNYQPLPLFGTRWYKRIVNSSYKSAIVCRDTSSSTRILVNSPVLNYNISLLTGGTTQTICNSQTPTPLQGDPPSGPTGGNSTYAYQWMYSLDNSTFNTVPSGGTTANYAPPSLTSPTYYRRDIISGACNVSSNVITITVLPLISNNIISGTPRVCNGLVPGLITGASLSGGSGIYKYFWQLSNNDGTSWTAADGTNSSASYQAPALTAPVKYRRTVTSGLNDCCSNISNSFDISIDPMPVSPVFAGPPASIYSIDKIYHMQAINPGLVGETGTWSVLNNGTGTIDDTTKYNTIVRNLSAKNVNSFLWTVHRGQCKLSDTVNITLNEDFEPRAFSPNGDGANDTFIVEGLDKEDNWIDLTIVNGAGTEVFSTTNRNGQQFNDWNGKNSRGLDLSEGTYYYLLKITPKDGTSTSKKSGFIILKRY